MVATTRPRILGHGARGPEPEQDAGAATAGAQREPPSGQARAQHRPGHAAEDVARLVGGAAQDDGAEHRSRATSRAETAPPKPLADRLAQVASGDDREARAGLLEDEAGHGRERQGPEKPWTVERPSGGGGGDGAGSDEGRGDDGPEENAGRAVSRGLVSPKPRRRPVPPAPRRLEDQPVPGLTSRPSMALELFHRPVRRARSRCRPGARPRRRRDRTGPRGGAGSGSRGTSARGRRAPGRHRLRRGARPAPPEPRRTAKRSSRTG